MMVIEQRTYFVTDESFQFFPSGTNDESKSASQSNNVIVTKQFEKKKTRIWSHMQPRVIVGPGPTNAWPHQHLIPHVGPISAWSHMWAPPSHGPTCGPHQHMVPHRPPPAHVFWFIIVIFKPFMPTPPQCHVGLAARRQPSPDVTLAQSHGHCPGRQPSHKRAQSHGHCSGR
jgi:hypothetical protein